jgi:hypothetical protein
MMRTYTLLLALLAFSLVSRAQSGTGFGFEYRPVAKVVQGTDTLRNAWAGGFNTPQFSTIDLNNDGQQDLFAFDHETSRCYTFLSVAAPAAINGRRWEYAPQYESLFPADLEGWALLRDYDCDGRADLFTYANGGDIRVFRNVLANGRPSFVLATNQIRCTGNFPGSSNLNVGGYNLPAIQDVNGDGKLDIMNYDFYSSAWIEQYINTSADPCGSALSFFQTQNQWGGLESCSGCGSYTLNGQSCFTARPTHTGGHSLLLVDLDGDGDQDLIDGRDNCPELSRLLNVGTTTSPVVTQASISSSFPSATAPVNVPVFPAGYSFDANFDGRPDLVVAPNMVNNQADLVSMSHQIQLFTNSAATGAPAYNYQANGFLQSDMIDVSEAAAPTFGDIDSDGLVDMLIGNHADRVNNVYRAALAYYRNVGTRTRPIFKLMNSDYLGLSTQNLLGIKPVLVDLDRNGTLDLAYSVWDRGTNVLYYILNTAAVGQPAAFNAANAVNFKPQGPTGVVWTSPTPTSGVLTYFKGDMPCFTDVDNDGYVDLLMGTNESREPGMALRYFRNRGRGPLDSAFVLVDNDFGHIRDAAGQRPVNLSPTVADFDGDGRPDLVVADEAGILRFYSDYRNQNASLFSERNDVLYNPLTGVYENNRFGKGLYTRYGLAAADVNGDGAPELFVGTEAGGVLSYGTRNRGTVTATHTEAARVLALSVYPNPATASATVETATPTRLTVLDLTGRVVQTVAVAQRRHTLNLTGLAAGVYLVRAVGTDGAAAVQRLAVQ